MKLVVLSDIHGDLPEITTECDVVCICGDIVPLYYQSSFTKSVEWLKTDFKNWCIDLPCEKVIIIAGNHDFVFERLYVDLVNDTKTNVSKDICQHHLSLGYPDSFQCSRQYGG